MERQANFIPFSTSVLTLKKMSKEAFYNLMPQALMLMSDKYYNYSILKKLGTPIFKLASRGPKYLIEFLSRPEFYDIWPKNGTDKSILSSL